MTDIAMSDQLHPVDDEDTIMLDASMLIAEDTDLGPVDATYDPMDISPIPTRHESPIDTQPQGTVPGDLTNPSSHSSGLGQNDAAPASPSYRGRGFFNNNVTRSPFIRVAKRFSPRSMPSPNPYLVAVNPARSVLRPLRLQNQTPIADPLERMKRMFRPREEASVMGIPSQQVSENKTAEQSSEVKPTLHLGVKESPAGFNFPFSIHESEASRKRCHNEDPARPYSHDAPEVAGQVNSKYRRVSNNDFPASAIKANDKDSIATSTTAPTKPSSRVESLPLTTHTESPSLTTHTESPHSSPTHDNRTSSNRVTDAISPAATSYHIPGAWPDDEDAVMTYDETPTMNESYQNESYQNEQNEQNENAMDIDQNEQIIQSVEIDECGQGIKNMGLDSNEASLQEQNASTWHAYWQAAFQGTTKAVGTLLNLVRDTFSSAPSFGPFVDQTFSIFRRRRRASPERRRGSREPSPTHQQSTTFASLRSLSEEQRLKIRCHKWRKEVGLAGPTELPFPELNIEYPPSTTSHNPAHSTLFAVMDKLAKDAEIKQRQKQKTHRQKDKHRNRRESSSSRHKSRKAKGKQPARYSVHKRSRRTTPRKQSTAAASQSSQAWVQPISPKAQRRVFFAHTPPRRYPELAEKERLYAAWRNSLGTKRQKELEAQMKRAAAAGWQNVTGLANEQRKSNEEKAVVRLAPAGPAEEQRTLNEKDAPQQKNKKNLKVHFAEPLELPTPIAPHLRPDPSQTKPDEEQKENIPPVIEDNVDVNVPEVTVENAPGVTVENEAPQEPVSESETDEDAWLRLETPFGRPVSAVRMFYPNPQPIPSGRTESIYAAEWRRIQEDEQRQERQTRIRPDGPAVRPLSEIWEDKVNELRRLPPSRKVATTLAGDPLSQRDMATCYTPMAWLNDEMINSYLALIIEYLRRTHNNAGRHDKPRFHAFNSFFFSNLRDKGYESVRRWASRAKIGGESLLAVDTVVVPVHHNAHWTLIIVRPMAKTIEHFDSLGPPSRSHIAVIQSWLREELGPKYRGDQWTVVPSRSPQQNNGSDCGVFLLTTAKAVAIGLEPLSYGAGDICLLRRKIVAELMAGRLEGEFDPAHGGEVLL